MDCIDVLRQAGKVFAPPFLVLAVGTLKLVRVVLFATSSTSHEDVGEGNGGSGGKNQRDSELACPSLREGGRQ